MFHVPSIGHSSVECLLSLQSPNSISNFLPFLSSVTAFYRLKIQVFVKYCKYFFLISFDFILGFFFFNIFSFYVVTLEFLPLDLGSETLSLPRD